MRIAARRRAGDLHLFIINADATQQGQPLLQTACLGITHAVSHAVQPQLPMKTCCGLTITEIHALLPGWENRPVE